MSLKGRWILALTLISGAFLNGTVNSTAATSKEAAEAAAMMSGARERDPAWKPACAEVGVIQIGDSKQPGALKNFCLNAEGNILACFVPNDAANSSAGKNAPAIRVYSPKGELLNTLPIEIKAGVIAVGRDGSIFVAGDGRLLKLDAAGKMLASAPSPVANEPVSIGKDVEEMIK